MDFEWSYVFEAIPALLVGAKLTVYIAVVGLAGGIFLGAVAGISRAYGGIVVNTIATLYVALIRGTPIVVQVMFIYFALPTAFGISMDGLTASVVTIAINAGAYIAEIVRGAFLSVSKGLEEAGLALGLPRWKVLTHVLGPVAVRRMVPALGNQCIISLKDTSLFIVIGVGELTRQGQEIMASNFRALEIWSTIAVFYLIMVGVLALALRVLERRMRIL